MPALQIVASQPLQGKTAIAAGLAQLLAAASNHVRLLRVGDDDAASHDAATFSSFTFASSAGRPVEAAAIGRVEANEVLIIELPAGAEPLANIPALIVVRGTPNEACLALGRSIGSRLVGSIATAVRPSEVEQVARALTNGDLKPIAILAENRLLTAPSVDEIRAALDAAVYYEGENEDEVVEEVLIGPVYADPARPHFRKFASKAILAPFNKTDLLLAAIETQTACLVVTGGGEPSPYLLDRVRGESTTVLLSKYETPVTLAALADVWSGSRFRGQAKLRAISAALAAANLDLSGLLRKLS